MNEISIPEQGWKMIYFITQLRPSHGLWLSVKRTESDLYGICCFSEFCNIFIWISHGSVWLGYEPLFRVCHVQLLDFFIRKSKYSSYGIFFLQIYGLYPKYSTWVSRTVAALAVTIGSVFMSTATPEKSIYIYVGMCIYTSG